MNQLLQYVLISGIVISITGTAMYHSMDSINFEMISYHDKMEIIKKQATEKIKMIELFDNPLMVDILNIGENEIIIKRIFVDGEFDDNYTIDGETSNVIEKNKIVRIVPSLSGSNISLLSENYKIFNFE